MKVILWVLALCWLAAVEADGLVTVSPEQMRRLGIAVQSPEPVNRVPLKSVPAQVTVPPQNDRVISAPLSGVVEQVTVSRGDSIAAGQMVLRLDSPELLGHQRHFLNAWQEFHVADARYQREKELHRAGIIAKRRWLETEKLWRQARTALDQARHELMLLGLHPSAIDRLLQTGRLDSHLDLRSPVAAVVWSRLVTLGQRVQRADPLLRLIVPQPLWLELAVPVALAKTLQPGTIVRVESEGAEGRVFLVGSLVDPDSQTVLVRAEMVRPGGLRPGRKLTARLTLPVTGVFKLPRTALIEQGGGYFIFVRHDAGFEARSVTPLLVTSEAAYIQRGLRPGEPVAVSGTAALKAAWLGVGETE